MPLVYNPREVCSKLSREQPPATGLRGGARKSMLRCLSARCAAAHAHSTQPADGLQRAKVLPTLPLPDELVQPPFASLLCMYLRCVRATRASARDICSTLPARRVDLSRFTMSVRRMGLLCSNASRDSIRVFAGRCVQCVRTYPSSRLGRALTEAAMEGTRAWTALGHREVPRKVPTAPLSIGDWHCCSSPLGARCNDSQHRHTQ